MAKKKERIDALLVGRGLARSRAEAQALLIAGQVVVGGARVEKAGTRIQCDAAIRLTGVRGPFVSRGGVKLAAALDAFGIDVTGRSAIDVGASTGGFTDCLLSRGAHRVFCVDVGRGQLAEKLRADPRVVVRDRFNARKIVPEDLPFACDIAVVDVSFISLRLIIPPLAKCLPPAADVVALVKPQFEVGRGKVGKGGIVRDPALRDEAVSAVEAMAREHRMTVCGKIASPIAGADGNIESLLFLTTPRNS
ncbi:MAG: TlyA family RNA methyltransferase [Deltaproteobacteria bacterium]|nr:TlyA family RNA methyltransferase [Deltaproteobacteria bacterium]